jgi:hypothetical protein
MAYGKLSEATSHIGGIGMFGLNHEFCSHMRGHGRREAEDGRDPQPKPTFATAVTVPEALRAAGHRAARRMRTPARRSRCPDAAGARLRPVDRLRELLLQFWL